MKKEIEINEWIESYLNGDLSAQDTSVFRKRLEDEPAFAREVEQHMQLREIITEGAFLQVKDQLISIHLHRMRTFRRIKRITGYGIGGIMIGVIALLVYREIQGDSTREATPFATQTAQPSGSDFDQNFSANGSAGPITKRGVSSGTLKQDNRQKGFSNKTENGEASVFMDSSIVTSGSEKTAAEVNPAGNPVNTHRFPETKQEAENVSYPGKEKAGEADCRKVKIEGSFTEYESCSNKPTGGVIVNRKSVTGGFPPYTFSLNNVTFTDTIQFGGLYPGSYPLYARDSNNCIGRLGFALIRSVDCSYQAVFAPLKGELWTVPADPEREGILNIFNKSGNLVYTVRIPDHETITWNGATLSGQSLPMGIYPFEIRYTTGNSFTGTVTIVR